MDHPRFVGVPDLRMPVRSPQSPRQRNDLRFGLVAVFLVILAAAASARAADFPQAFELFRTGKYVECIESAAEAISKETITENYWLLIIRSELELGRYAEAEKTLTEGLKRLPGSLELRWWGREVCRYNNQPERARQLDAEFAGLVERFPSRYTDAVNRVAIARFLLSHGVDPKKVLDGLINDVKKRQPSFAPAYLASGDLALEKNDFALAAEAFSQAARLNPADPDAHFGLAQAFAPSDSAKAQEALKKALDLNPNHVSSLLLMADELIDSERYDLVDEVLQEIADVNPHNPRAAAYRAVLAHVRNQPEREEREHAAGLKFWSANPVVDFLIGKKLAQKYRFEEAAKYQRQALKLDPKYVPAKTELAQDLLRLGQEDEGWKLADEILEADAYNVVAHNLTVLQENLAQFRSIEEDGLIARMDAVEAEIYGGRVIELLKRAKRELCAKYEVTIDQPVIVEMFPRQQDFAIRTFGLPGGAGFLGVCFGTVITANSPASQAEHPACWESTLWHEFCHVVTLNKTHNRMPRWLSEGISVYEERQANAAWGQSITPAYREMLLADDLTAVSRLSGAFLNPPTPRHLQFAYFESSLVVEFLVESYGLTALKSLLTDLGKGLPINDALTRHAGSLDELDARFRDYARKKAAAMAPEADWSEPALPPRADAAAVADWLEDHPANYAALKRLARQLVADKQWEAAKEPLERMRRLYPRDAGADSHYLLSARVYRELGENDRERSVLESFGELSADNVEVFARLMELASQEKDWGSMRKYALRWLAVNPLTPEPYRRMAEAAEQLHDFPLAISGHEALLKLDPIDQPGTHLRLASALRSAGDLAAAKRHVLLALEETPRYRAAQRLLLEIVRDEEHGAGKAERAPDQGTDSSTGRSE